MKTCEIWGDLSSNKTSENYPSVSVCDECYKAHSEGKDAEIIAVVGNYDSSYGEECYFCEISYEDEIAGHNQSKRSQEGVLFLEEAKEKSAAGELTQADFDENIKIHNTNHIPFNDKLK